MKLVYVGGGMTFSSYNDYLSYLQTKSISLEDEPHWTDFVNTPVIKVPMPNKHNAQYNEWSLLFQRYYDLIGHDAIYIGYSLGGVFLAKWFDEHQVSASKLLLVAPPFANDLPDEELVNGFAIDKKTLHIDAQVVCYFSTQDTIVPLQVAQQYKQALPQATIHILDKTGHFFDATFPELEKELG